MSPPIHRPPIACVLAACGLLALGSPRPARGDLADSRWASLSAPAGLDGRALTLMTYGDELIAGGEFDAAGTVVLNHIGAWDGTRWRPFGEGFDFPVTSLGVFHGDVIAGGEFTESGGRPMAHVARWNGSTWEPLGQGFSSAPTCFAEWNGGLVAGGTFRCRGGDEGCANDWNSIPELPFAAFWDGTSWAPMGDPGTFTALTSVPSDLAVYRGALYATTSSTCPRCSGTSGRRGRLLETWDGAGWVPVGPMVDRLPPGNWGGGTCLAVWDTLLVVGGTFTFLDSTRVNRVIAYDGRTWSPMGAGVRGGLHDLEVVDGTLYGVGWLMYDGLVQWDGTSWVSVASGPIVMRALAGVGGTVYVADGSGASAGAIRVLNGNSLQGLRVPGGTQLIYRIVRSLASYQGTIIYNLDGESFREIHDPPPGSRDYNVAPHDHHGIGPVWNPELSAPSVVYRDKLLTGWSTWDGSTVTNIARPLGLRYPRALTVFQDKVIAAGTFWDLPASGEVLFAWDGESWTSLAPGIRPSSLEDQYADLWMTQIDALAAYGDRVIAGGLFDFDAPVGGKNIAAWDGEAWRPLGDGVDDMVTSLVDYHQELIAAGFFDNAGGTPAAHLARWDGVAWHPLGPGTNGPVYTLTVFNDRLVAGGRFDHAGDLAAGNLAAWDGQGWISLGSGTDGEVMALAANGGELYVGGEFSRAGGKTSYHLARWTEGPREAAFSSLTADRTDGEVIVRAQTSYLPFDHQGLLVYRRDAEGTRVPLTPRQSADAQYTFVDSPAPLGPATYWIASVASTGAETVSDSVEVSADPRLRFAAHPARPNPFRAQTRLDFNTAREGRSRVRVFDVRGRRVADLLDAVLPVGEHSVAWDGRDASGRPVAAGTYFIRLSAPEGERVQRIVRSAP